MDWGAGGPLAGMKEVKSKSSPVITSDKVLGSKAAVTATVVHLCLHVNGSVAGVGH